MGLKSIDMQIAIPRTQDASRMQDQIMKQGQQLQDKLTDQQLKQEKIRRTKVNKHEDVRQKNIQDKTDEDHLQLDSLVAANDEQRLYEEKKEHPYLGKHIDISR